LYYVTADPTTKNGSLWILELDLPWPARIALPRDALILSVDPQPGVSIEGDTVYLVYEPGRVRVSYVIVPVEVIATESPGQPPGETATETPATIPPPGDEEASPVDGLAAEMPSWVPLLLGGAVAVASLAFLLLRRGRSGAPEAVVGSSGLDERDQAIIEAVRRLGEATSSELMEATGIPKTPLYRRLGKLVDMGYLESFERAGKRYYRVKKR
ncbi:MAG: winged helix-turn-helix transcriptional regulator, partial [Desulfurococcales archaeon]|nr:winged helix-turn-helix transcriptional regulator [Desulfurococcales archaeon]